MTRSRPDAFMAQERAAVFIVRAWIEEDGGVAFKARITYSLDLSRPDEANLVASEPAEVRAALASWLDEFTASRRGDTPRDGGVTRG